MDEPSLVRNRLRYPALGGCFGVISRITHVSRAQPPGESMLEQFWCNTSDNTDAEYSYHIRLKVRP